MTAPALTRSDIAAAQQGLHGGYCGFLRETPLWKLPGAQLGLPCREVWLKLEHLQVGGSFKARGMLNRMLAQPVPASGVVIASGGNAGIATAAAAQMLGVRCEVFVPEVSSEAKRARLRQLGAHVVVAGLALRDNCKPVPWRCTPTTSPRWSPVLPPWPPRSKPKAACPTACW
jgi:threonine dehydratase